jgi:predicted aspartyl protease
MREGVVMLLDTGADVTLLPQAVAGELGLSQSGGS